MRGTLFLITLVAGACTASGGGNDSALEFSPARVVSQETTNGATPMLLTTTAGDRLLAWVSAEDGGPDGRLHFSVTPAGATEPLPTVTVADPLGGVEPHGEAPPKLAQGDDGAVYLLYSVGKKVPGLRFPLSSLRLIRSDDLGRSWTDPVTINAGEQFGAHNFHALNAGGGMVVATWLHSDRGVAGVSMSRSFDRGATFEPHRSINIDPSCPCCRTAVAIGPSGTMYVAWRTIIANGEGPQDDIRDIVVMRSDDRGETWSQPVRPRQDDWVYPGCPHAGPSMQVDETGTVHITWWTGKPGEAGVYYARSDDRGDNWAASPLKTGERSAPSHVQLVAGNGNVFVTWDDGMGQLPEVVMRRSTDRGLSFGRRQLLSSEGFAASFPVLTLYGDTLAVVWGQRGEKAHRQAMASRPDMSDPASVLDLPRVGQSEIFERKAALGR